MIPKILIYCNFGNMNIRSEIEGACIETWEKYFPKDEWNWVELNESNFDYNSIPYTKKCYELEKYSMVSDYARVDYLYHHGGIYVDTDLYMLKSLNDKILEKSFIGSNCTKYNNPNFTQLISWGIVGFEKGNPILKYILDSFNNYEIKDNNMLIEDKINRSSILDFEKININNFLKDDVIVSNNLNIYPFDYFTCNKNSNITISDRSYSIHLYARSWKNNIFDKLKLNKTIENLNRIKEVKNDTKDINLL